MRLFYVVCRDPCYQSPRELWWSKLARSCSNRVGFYNFFSLWSPQKQLITVETRLFLLLFAEIHGYQSPLGNCDGQNSHALAPTALVSITFLIYGPQKKLITVETLLLSVVCRDPCYQRIMGIMMVRIHTLLLLHHTEQRIPVDYIPPTS